MFECLSPHSNLSLSLSLSLSPPPPLQTLGGDSLPHCDHNPHPCLPRDGMAGCCLFQRHSRRHVSLFSAALPVPVTTQDIAILCTSLLSLLSPPFFLPPSFPLSPPLPSSLLCPSLPFFPPLPPSVPFLQHSHCLLLRHTDNVVGSGRQSGAADGERENRSTTSSP